jgi:SAM-dependent methyltransferase
MLWLGWADAGVRWGRGTIKVIERAAALVSQDERLSAHERGKISASSLKPLSLELHHEWCTVRVQALLRAHERVSASWMGVTPARDALAIGEPGQPLPVLRIDVLSPKGNALSGVMLVADGLFEPQEVAWGLQLPYESSVARPGCLPVLASDRRPSPTQQPHTGGLLAHAFKVFRCENPSCRAHGLEVLVRTDELPAVLQSGHGVAYPCPACTGGWQARWALKFVRIVEPRDATRRLPVVEFPIRPTRARRSPAPGPMQMVERSDTPFDLSKWMVPQVPRKVQTFLRSRKLSDLIGAMRDDPAQTGALLSGILTTENLRALVHSVRTLPLHRRHGGIATALAHGFFPRRPAIYKVAHEAAQETHHHYIALHPETFLKKLIYYRAMDCTGSFLDVGCGIGEKSFLAYALGAFSRCDGLEFDPRTLAVGSFLLQQIATQDPYPIGFEQADALTYGRYADYDVIYMFRPMHDARFMNRLLRHIAENMHVGAMVFDAFRDDCALMKVGPQEFRTTRMNPRSGLGEWDVPVSIEEFLQRMDLAD